MGKFDLSSEYMPKVNNSSTETEKQADNQEKKTVGRPKGKETTGISLRVPDELLEYAKIMAKAEYKGNLTNYIVSLIEKDVAKHKDKLEPIVKAYANLKL